jgi:hypothetical protein
LYRFPAMAHRIEEESADSFDSGNETRLSH